MHQNLNIFRHLLLFRSTISINLRHLIRLTASIGGSKLRSIGFIMMNTCWFLWVSPDSSLSAALQKYWTQPCLPKKVEGRPKGRPNLKGKLWMPPDNSTGSPPKNVKKKNVKLLWSCQFNNRKCIWDFERENTIERIGHGNYQFIHAWPMLGKMAF